MLVNNWIEKNCFKLISVIAYRAMLKLTEILRGIVIQIMKWKLRLAVNYIVEIMVIRCRDNKSY